MSISFSSSPVTWINSFGGLASRAVNKETGFQNKKKLIDFVFLCFGRFETKNHLKP